jgi:hypothetical protein
MVQLTSDGRTKIATFTGIPDPMATDGSRIYFEEFPAFHRSTLQQVSVEGGEPAPVPLPFTGWGLAGTSPNRPELLVLGFTEPPAAMSQSAPVWAVPHRQRARVRRGLVAGWDSDPSFPRARDLSCLERRQRFNQVSHRQRDDHVAPLVA